MSLSCRFEGAVADALGSGGSVSGALFLAAVSGGADSVAMLAALVALRGRLGFDLRCVHVEHGIRAASESRGDAEFVRGLCAGFGVPCRIVRVKPGAVARVAEKRGVGIEAAARFYRHRAWNRELARVDAVLASGGLLGVRADQARGARVLVAHTADDLLETALMRVLRGAGPSGLAAMPASRERILRPLLALSREDARAYLAENKIAWHEDSTNADPRFLRNRIRRRLAPLLSEEFPGWKTALLSLAQTQALAAGFIAGEARARVVWQPAPRARGFVRSEGVALCADEDVFFAQPVIVREEAIFQGVDALLAGGAPSCAGLGVRRAAVRGFARGKATAADLGRVQLRRKDGIIVLSGRKKSAFAARGSESGFSLLINAPGFYTLKGASLEVGDGAHCGAERGDAFAADGAFAARLPFVVRPSFKEDRVGRASGGGGALCAEDSLGIAAFIGNGALLACRQAVSGADCGRAADGGACVVRVMTERSTVV